MLLGLIKKYRLLLTIFLIAVFIRFLYFPGNIYFGFDQARDAFSALEIASGKLKLTGPSTSIPGLYHGVLYDYIIAPVYFIGQGSPEVLSAILRIANALGVLIIFYFAKVLFQREEKSQATLLVIGIMSAALFAFSFEQTQFSIYMGNPTLASLSVMLMYLGLALVIFAKKNYGLPIAAFFLGASIQFEFGLFYLTAPFLLTLGFFYKDFIKVPLKIWLISTFAFLISVSSFILVELKYNFRSIKTLLNLNDSGFDRSFSSLIQSYFYTISRMTELNITGEIIIRDLLTAAPFVIFIFLILQYKQYRSQLIFLAIYFFGLFFIYLLGGARRDNGEPLYYTNIGISPSLILLVGFLIALIFKKSKILAITLLLLIIITNLRTITFYNPKGTISAINVQQGMLLQDEKKILDLIYQDAKGEIFAAKALTMPFAINTTWSYLFEWYGQKKYGYLPIWGDKNAAGFPGNLKVDDRQHSLPKKRYLVVEPLRGIQSYTIDDYFRIEGYFTKVDWEKQVGAFKLQRRTLY